MRREVEASTRDPFATNPLVTPGAEEARSKLKLELRTEEMDQKSEESDDRKQAEA